MGACTPVRVTVLRLVEEATAPYQTGVEMTDKELAEVYRRNMETLGEQVARLRALVERAQRCLPECYETWHRDAAEALR
jgi:hypothetical protein